MYQCMYLIYARGRDVKIRLKGCHNERGSLGEVKI